MLELGKKILNRGVGQMVRKIKSKDKKQELKADKKRALTEHREILKEREQSRQDLGITQEEEKRLFKYIRLNRGKGLSEKELFFKALDIITEEKKERVQQEKRKQKNKTDDLLLEIEKGKYLLAELRRDRKRTEKYSNELKELI